MKSSGNDVDMTIDLGNTYNFNEVSIDNVILENRFCSFSPSINEDFSDFAFSCVSNGVTINYTIEADQYVSLYGSGGDPVVSTDSFSAFIKQKTGRVNLNADQSYGRLLFINPTCDFVGGPV